MQVAAALREFRVALTTTQVLMMTRTSSCESLVFVCFMSSLVTLLLLSVLQ